ncbi:class I SAM-dependent methyltransferase [Rhodobacter ferrooxidans]|uniref:Phosphatidylethanolamine N-methyltransferase n=1 Tax=Rhodobacter ferrooxidans TaxID=371731 RepID=C8S0A8_9RHOB|nr:class I SAM-dependent methyltransferase [Rhodobacter sp. SW2]EEW25717.1 Phosphatidylethanolamine N-methyltransferase [Rhodobacter sp. SW2]
MDLHAVQKSYARWAPIYDLTFGAITDAGRRAAVSFVNRAGGDVLEVGVGTGLALRRYGHNVRVTGVDYSAEMLEKAQEKVKELRLRQVVALEQMDARALGYPDDSFDHVMAMHIMSVVPEPEKVLAEMARVCRPGGSVIVVNHFAREAGFLAVAEKAAAPMVNLLGWHSDFARARVMGEAGLLLKQERTLPPFGMMTMLRFRKL